MKPCTDKHTRVRLAAAVPGLVSVLGVPAGRDTAGIYVPFGWAPAVATVRVPES